MHMILYPYGGLANRLRTIDSAVNICRKQDKLTIWWFKDKGLNCEFSKIFKTVPFIIDKEMTKSFRRLFKYYDQKKIALHWFLFLLEKLHILIVFDDIKGLRKSNSIKGTKHFLICFIRSWEAFYPLEDFHKELFVLHDFNNLNEELEKINRDTVGVHIRRTDNIWSVENSPLEIFKSFMRNEIAREPNTNFYLCSDDEETKAFFHDSFWEGKVKMPSGVLTRNSEEGIIQAAIEMFALSKTRKILGSYWSSFGEVAARLGNIEIEVCTTSQS